MENLTKLELEIFDSMVVDYLEMVPKPFQKTYREIAEKAFAPLYAAQKEEKPKPKKAKPKKAQAIVVNTQTDEPKIMEQPIVDKVATPETVQAALGEYSNKNGVDATIAIVAEYIGSKSVLTASPEDLEAILARIT